VEEDDLNKLTFENFEDNINSSYRVDKDALENTMDSTENNRNHNQSTENNRILYEDTNMLKTFEIEGDIDDKETKLT
jgi:hypothetical protein